MTHSAVYYALLAACGDDIPANAGCYRAGHGRRAGGQRRQCGLPRARSPDRIVVTHRIADRRLRRAAAGRAGAHPGRLLRRSPMSTPSRPTNRRASGRSCRDRGRRLRRPSERDGASALSCGLHNNTNTPIEMIEAKYPLTFTQYGLIPDFRRRRQVSRRPRPRPRMAARCRRGPLSTNFERFRHAPYGLAGGEPGSLSRTTVTHPDGSNLALRSKVSGIPLKARRRRHHRDLRRRRLRRSARPRSEAPRPRPRRWAGHAGGRVPVLRRRTGQGGRRHERRSRPPTAFTLTLCPKSRP